MGSIGGQPTQATQQSAQQANIPGSGQGSVTNNGFGQQQYYNPNQYGNRYPGYSYPPQPQQPGQQGQGQPPASETEGSQPNSQHSQGQSQPQPNAQQPVMPQYGGYQQYPQYGYQDSTQYRGWY